MTDLLVRGPATTVPPLHGDPDREHVEVERLRRRLGEEFAGSAAPGEIDRLVDDAVALFRDATVRQFVPLLVERHVRRAFGPRGR